MSRADSTQAGIPKSIAELTTLRGKFERNAKLRSADLAPAVAAVETTYHRLAAMMREMAFKEYQEDETKQASKSQRR